MEGFYPINIDFRNEAHIRCSLSILAQAYPWLRSSFFPEFWRWKYINTPMGEPIGWAIVNPDMSNRFCAIRLFWPWIFTGPDGEQHRAYQAVDTFTAPDFRRRGFSSTLAELAIEEITKRGSFIYNFPNDNSYPLYKNLGWIDIAHAHWRVRVLNLYKLPIFAIRIALRRVPILSDLPQGKLASYSVNRAIERGWDPEPSSEQKSELRTAWTDPLVRWRFAEHPWYQYYLYSPDYDSSSWIIFRSCLRRGLKEAMIVACSMPSDCSNSLGQNFRRFARSMRFEIISTWVVNNPIPGIFDRNSFRSSGKYAVYHPCGEKRAFENDNCFSLCLGDSDYF